MVAERFGALGMKRAKGFEEKNAWLQVPSLIDGLGLLGGGEKCHQSWTLVSMVGGARLFMRAAVYGLTMQLPVSTLKSKDQVRSPYLTVRSTLLGQHG